jgi:hypothetical protein
MQFARIAGAQRNVGAARDGWYAARRRKCDLYTGVLRMLIVTSSTDVADWPFGRIRIHLGSVSGTLMKNAGYFW